MKVKMLFSKVRTLIVGNQYFSSKKLTVFPILFLMTLKSAYVFGHGYRLHSESNFGPSFYSSFKNKGNCATSSKGNLAIILVFLKTIILVEDASSKLILIDLGSEELTLLVILSEGKEICFFCKYLTPFNTSPK